MSKVALSSCTRLSLRPGPSAVPRVFTRNRQRAVRPSRPVVTADEPWVGPEAFAYMDVVTGNRKAEEVYTRQATPYMGAKQPRNRSFETRQRVPPATPEQDMQTLVFREAPRTNIFTREQLLDFLADEVRLWATSQTVFDRFVSYGCPPRQLKSLLFAFRAVISQKSILDDLSCTSAEVDRLAYDLSERNNRTHVDEHFSRLFWEWAAQPARREEFDAPEMQPVLTHIEQLFEAVDLSNPAAAAPMTRVAPRRKVIMHVGPTNSGKTYNALRALAAAKHGVYAGPLRLLALEIFERLNKGQIVPQGMDPDAEAEPDENTNLELAEKDKKVVQKQGNPKFARVCNLVTGEERRILDLEAGLESCTVEMIGTSVRRLEVAVVDEIQMIADPERGGAWKDAVLGLNADELHLCGEERAVPLIEAMLKDTGDELIVHKYERLTPLQVADKSLEGNFKLIQKGDCVVTFSRTKIFHLKNAIEKETGLKCAIVYGALPPEIRSSQAAMFNDADSGYDVIIGSDAIGMGLNLKIKRMIFEDVRKWNGLSQELLTLSSFKQIAGRAGRFVLNGQNLPGIATTLRPDGLLILRRALELPIEPIRYARYSVSYGEFAKVMRVLPADTPLWKVQQLFRYVSKLHPRYELVDSEKKLAFCHRIDEIAPGLTVEDRLRFGFAPVKWQKEDVVRIASQMINMYERDMFVDYRRLMRSASDVGAELEDLRALVDGKMDGGVDALNMRTDELLQHLEILHATLGTYVWLSYRQPVVYPHREQVVTLLQELRRGMMWCLNHITSDSQSKAPKVSRPSFGFNNNKLAAWKDSRGPQIEKPWGVRREPMRREQGFGLRRAEASS